MYARGRRDISIIISQIFFFSTIVKYIDALSKKEKKKFFQLKSDNVRIFV